MNINKLITESIYKVLNENIAVWKYIDKIKEYSNSLYNLLQENKDYLKQGGTFQKQINIADIDIHVIFEKVNKREYSGISKNLKNEIFIYVDLDTSEKNIESILIHELTHQDNKKYNTQKIGHYFGQHTFSWQNTKSKAMDTVNEILYNLWSNDEQSAYQSYSSYKNFGTLKDRYEYLKGLIDSLSRKMPNEDVLYSAVNSYLKTQRRPSEEIKNELRKKSHNRLPSDENFKDWFIQQSYKRLENYWKRLKKNWYEYHSEVNPDGAIQSLRNVQSNLINGGNVLNQIKPIVIKSVDKIANRLTKAFIVCLEDYWPYSYGYPEYKIGNVRIKLDTWIKQKQVKQQLQWGYRTVWKSSFLNVNKPATFSIEKDGTYSLTFNPNRYLDNVMGLNKHRGRDNFEYNESDIYKEIKKIILKQIKNINLEK